MSQRAFYSIDPFVLEGFNRLVPSRKRSKLVQNLMAKHVLENESVLERAARMIEADMTYREVMSDVQGATAATLERLETYE